MASRLMGERLVAYVLQRAVDGEPVEARVDAADGKVPLAGGLRQRVAQQRTDHVAGDRGLVGDVGRRVHRPDAVVQVARRHRRACRDDDFLDRERKQGHGERRLRTGAKGAGRDPAVAVAATGDAYLVGSPHPQAGLVKGAVGGGDGGPRGARGAVHDLDPGRRDRRAGGRTDMAVQRGGSRVGDRGGRGEHARGAEEATHPSWRGRVHVGGSPSRSGSPR